MLCDSRSALSGLAEPGQKKSRPSFGGRLGARFVFNNRPKWSGGRLSGSGSTIAAHAVFLEALESFEMLLALAYAGLLVVRVLANVLRDTLLDTLSLEAFQRGLDVFILAQVNRYHHVYHNLFKEYARRVRRLSTDRMPRTIRGEPNPKAPITGSSSTISHSTLTRPNRRGATA